MLQRSRTTVTRWKIDQIKGKFNRTPVASAAKLGRVILEKYRHEEEMIEWRKREARQKRIAALQAEHEGWLCKREEIPKEIRGEFSEEEVDFLERNLAWLNALVGGELQPNALEQVRFIAVANGILRPRTGTEKAWKKYRELANS